MNGVKKNNGKDKDVLRLSKVQKTLPSQSFPSEWAGHDSKSAARKIVDTAHAERKICVLATIAVVAIMVVLHITAPEEDNTDPRSLLCPAQSEWDAALELCMCNDKFICDGCHDEYPHDEGFVMRPRSEVCVAECVFDQGVAVNGTMCGCADGFVISAAEPGWGATECAPVSNCTAAEDDCAAHNATCAHTGPGEHVCVCNRLYWCAFPMTHEASRVTPQGTMRLLTQSHGIVWHAQWTVAHDELSAVAQGRRRQR